MKKKTRKEIYDNAQQVIKDVGPAWERDHGWIRTQKLQLGYWDDFHFGMRNLGRPPYPVRSDIAQHVANSSPAFIIELMDEIDALKAQIENLGGVSLAEVKTNEA